MEETERVGSSWDFVVSARPASSEASFRDLEREFLVALKKLEGRV
jgi:RNase P protein component